MLSKFTEIQKKMESCENVRLLNTAKIITCKLLVYFLIKNTISNENNLLIYRCLCNK